MRSARVLTAVSTIFLLSAVALGQGAASIRGRVTDPSGAVIADATVQLVRTDTNTARATKTNSEGLYEFVQLASGPYRLTVAASGFATAERNDLNLIVNVPVTADFHLPVATSAEKVEVEGAAPMLNTTDATMGNGFDTRQVLQLPIEGRNVVELLSLQPGVTYLGNRIDAASDTRSGAVNGARSDQSNVTLDGVDVNDQNNGFAFTSVLRNTQDSVADFRVTTSNANADAGRSAGAQVALVTKSGTNQFHGSLYEYNRNTAFAANDYFLKASELASGQPNKRAQLIRNVFGASIGGPIIKNRLFFFANYEGRRDREAASEAQTVPSASMRAGQVIYQNINNGLTTLTPAQIQQMDPLGLGNDPAVLSILQSYPMPNDPILGDGLNTSGFRFAASEKRKFDTYIARLDYNLTSNGRHMLFARANLQNEHEGGAPQFPGQPPATTVLDNSKGFAVGYTAVLSPTKVNTFRWGFTRQGGETAGLSHQPEVTLAGISSPVAFSRSSSFHVPVHNFADDFAWTRGTHTLQFGGYARFFGKFSSTYGNSFSSADFYN